MTSSDDLAHDPFAREAEFDQAPLEQGGDDGVQVAPLATDIPGEEGIGAAVQTVAAGNYMTRDEFHSFFMGVFPIVGAVVAIRNPPPLQTLMTAGELPTARPASDAIYDLAEANEWLRWLIDKDARWIGQMMAIGAFGSQIFNGVTMELAQRREAAKAAEEAEPVSDG